MGRKPSGDIKIYRIVKKQKNGDRYVYERQSKYNPEKRYYVQIGSSLLGKMKEGSDDKYDLLPLRPKATTSKHDFNATKSTRYHFGMLSIVQHIENISGIVEELGNAIKEDVGLRLKIRTLAWFDFCSDGKAWTEIRNWSVRYHDMIPYSSTAFSKDMYHDVFEIISRDEDIRQTFFKERAKGLLDGELVALDSSTIVNESENIGYSRKTKHKDGRITKCFKLIVLYSVSTRRPIAFSIIPGQIPDSSTVLNAVRQLKAIVPSCKSVELVADNGYATASDLYLYFSEGQKFVTRIEANTTWISKLIEQCRDELEHGGGIIDCDPKFSGKAFLNVKRKFTKKKTQFEEGGSIEATINVFIYYSSVNKAKDDTYFRTKYSNIKEDLLNGRVLGDDKKEVEEFRDKYMNVTYRTDGTIESIQINRNAYDEHMKYNGYLVVLTSNEQDLNQALLKFRKREYIEEGIKNVKSHTGGRCARVWDEDTLDGEMFCWFVSLCLHETFETRIRYLRQTLNIPNGDKAHDKSGNMKSEREVLRWISSHSLHEILDWFDVIDYTVARGDGPNQEWRGVLTQRDALFLKLLGMDLDNYKPTL